MSYSQPGPYGQQPQYGAAPGGFPPPPAAPGVSNSDVADSTKGYRLVAPASIGNYRRSTDSRDELTAAQKERAEGLGVKNAQGTSVRYNAPSTDPDDPAKVGGKRLTFDGFHGEIADPAKALDNYFATVEKRGVKGNGKIPKGTAMQRVGTAEAVRPADFEGALMQCQIIKVINEKGDGTSANGAKEFQFPVCAWSDYSTFGGVNVVDLAQMTLGGKGSPPDEVAALTAELYPPEGLTRVASGRVSRI